MYNITILGVMIVFFAACAMPQGGMMMKRKGGGGMFNSIGQQPAQQAQPAAQTFVDESFEVVTDPPGARIMVNNTNYGNSPVQVVVRRLWRGDPNYPMTLDTVKVEALPVVAGQCIQTVVYGDKAGKTPPKVKFNMTNCGGGH